jgi:hypothetical protein
VIPDDRASGLLSSLQIPFKNGPVSPQTASDLADHMAVRALAPLYALGVDQRDEAMVKSVFASDAVIHGTIGDGPASEYIPKLIEGVGHYQATMHNITNQYVDLRRGAGEVLSYAIALHFEEPANGRTDMAMGVHYRDRVIRTTEGWLIAERTTVKLWTRGPFPR